MSAHALNYGKDFVPYFSFDFMGPWQYFFLYIIANSPIILQKEVLFKHVLIGVICTET